MLICTWRLCLSVQSSAEDRRPRTSAQRMPNRVVADSCLRHSIWISSKRPLYKGNWKKRGLSQFLFQSVCSEGIIDFRSTHETTKFRCHFASFDCYAAYTGGAWELLTNSETDNLKVEFKDRNRGLHCAGSDYTLIRILSRRRPM